jgi:RNA polymerase sigma-70 factor (ECF subfamily)
MVALRSEGVDRCEATILAALDSVAQSLRPDPAAKDSGFEERRKGSTVSQALEVVVAGATSDRERAETFRATFEDDRTFRTWYEDTIPRVFGYLFDRCGGVRSVAEELTQETFVEAVRSRATFDGRSDPTTWIVAIARHKLADHYRRFEREERRRLRIVSNRIPTVVLPADDVTADVLGALRSLPHGQRMAMVLHYLDGLPMQEIAGLMGRSESAVESLLSRGRTSMRAALAVRDEEEAHDA